jgi:hypothetical protein
MRLPTLVLPALALLACSSPESPLPYELRARAFTPVSPPSSPDAGAPDASATDAQPDIQSCPPWCFPEGNEGPQKHM